MYGYFSCRWIILGYYNLEEFGKNFILGFFCWNKTYAVTTVKSVALVFGFLLSFVKPDETKFMHNFSLNLKCKNYHHKNTEVRLARCIWKKNLLKKHVFFSTLTVWRGCLLEGLSKSLLVQRPRSKEDSFSTKTKGFTAEIEVIKGVLFLFMLTHHGPRNGINYNIPRKN